MNLDRTLVLLAVVSAAACVPSYNFDAKSEPGDTGDAASDVAARDARVPAPDSGGAVEADTTDAHSAPAADAVAPADAGAKYVACDRGDDAAVNCALGTQACCGIFANQPGFCVAIPDDAGACAWPGAAVALIECDQPSDCLNGTVCCMFDANLAAQTYSAIRCAAPERCVAPHAVECGLKLDKSDSACPAGQLCSQRSADGYYAFCH